MIPKIAIVGAGISGLTAALRLAQRGYAVTVYEEKPFIGGNLGGRPFPDGRFKGVNYDIYPHMYANFYHNFWELAEEDLGLERGKGKDFESRTGALVLDECAFPQFKALRNVGSFDSAVDNLLSGVESPADMLLWAYSMIDALSWPDSYDDMLDKISMEGLVKTRPYATRAVSELHDIILMTIWSIHSEQTSSAAYRRILQAGFRQPAPQTWLLTGDLKTKLLDPLQAKLEQHVGCKIHTSASAHAVELKQDGGRTYATRVMLKSTGDYDDTTQKIEYAGARWNEKVDAVILALPPKKLACLVQERSGDCRIVDLVPRLSQTRRLGAERIVVLDLYFTKRLPDIPKDHVLLRGSPPGLTFVDLSQLWHDNLHVRGRTVLTVAASDYFALPAETPEEIGHRLICALSEYLPDLFEPGKHWKDPTADIDWERTHVRTNDDAELFVNIVGGKAWQPVVHYREIPNLFFAGDCTVNDIRMATVESAVVSGLQAAQGICELFGIGDPVEIKRPECYSGLSILAMKTLLAPWAYAASHVSRAAEVYQIAKAGNLPQAKRSAISLLVDLYATPLAMAGDWLSSAARVPLRRPGPSRRPR